MGNQISYQTDVESITRIEDLFRKAGPNRLQRVSMYYPNANEREKL